MTLLRAEGDVSADARSAAAECPSLDLIEGHNSSEQRYLLKTEVYPSGAIRAVIKAVDMSAEPYLHAGNPQRNKRDVSEQERAESSVQRTRKTIRQRCMAFGVDRMLTLTYQENMEDRERCYSDTIKLIQRCQAAGYLPKYVAVPEQQKRGAWHVHIACKGFMWVQTIRRFWREIVGLGNIDMSYRHRNENNPWRIAAYLSKYIGKAIEQAKPGERTFWASEWGHLAPLCRVQLLRSGVTFTQVWATLFKLLGEKQEKGEIRVIEQWMPNKSAQAPPGYQPPLTVWAQ
jgi:hypothetical protein